VISDLGFLSVFELEELPSGEEVAVAVWTGPDIDTFGNRVTFDQRKTGIANRATGDFRWMDFAFR